MTIRRLHTLFALFAAGGLVGCGIADPYAHNAVRSSTTTSAPRAVGTTATVTNPSEPAPSRPSTTASGGVTADTSPSGASTPRQALRLYTRLYVNWTTMTIGAHQRQLAAISQGTARAAALQADASYSHDIELKNRRVANAGSIVSIAAGEGPERGRWVVVTSEHTTGSGDYTGLPASAHVTYAHLTHTPHGWVIDQWSPQN
jgi:hypothetical protein